MPRRRLNYLVMAAVFAWGLTVQGALAQTDSFAQRSRWLAWPGSLTAGLTRRAKEFQRSPKDAEERFWVGLGAVVFRAPTVLGLEARRIGMTCETCHGSGDANRRFFVAGLSSKPRTVDLTSAAFNRLADDGRFNPIRIPSLRGIAATAPYGHRGRFATLRAMTRHVIVDEFAGKPPAPNEMRALIAYLRGLKPAPNRLLGPAGRLTRAASDQARRGQALFTKTWPGARGRSCASCHRPVRAFTDGKAHDVGTGGRIETPSLLGAALGGPFMHDGRFERLDQAAGHYAKIAGRVLTPRQRGELVAYLHEVGATEGADEPITLAADLARVSSAVAVLAQTLKRKEPALAALVVVTVRRDIGHIHDRFPGAGHTQTRRRLVRWSRLLQLVARAAEKKAFTRARSALAKSLVAGRDARAALSRAAATSLYDPARLKAFLAARRN